MILLTTANARYSHSSLGLRYLYANMNSLQKNTQLLEFTIKDEAKTIADHLLSYSPQIIGLGIYIWNVELLTQTISILKTNQPKIVIVIGGPEVSYGVEKQLQNLVDYIIQQEGDLSFPQLCNSILANTPPKEKVIQGVPIDVNKIKLPYEFYTKEDIDNRKIYVEASRGCAFKCQFCLSSLDKGIRTFDKSKFLSQIKKLYERGARQFKFVDRTFNLNIKDSLFILDFFLESFPSQDYFLHFEIIPDRLPGELKEKILKFNKGVLQFEVGIQTFDSETSKRIQRRQNKTKAIESLVYLRQHTKIHLHVDLIIGLPGATINIFKDDLNMLVELKMQEIQIGILKHLKGTPIIEHKNTYNMIYDPSPPYEIKSTIDIDISLMTDLKHFAKYWDHFYNSGNFSKSLVLLFQSSNPFDAFFDFSKYVYRNLKKSWGNSLEQNAQVLYSYLHEIKKIEPAKAREVILQDLLKKKGRKVPAFLKDYTLGLPHIESLGSKKHLTRQENHKK